MLRTWGNQTAPDIRGAKWFWMFWEVNYYGWNFYNRWTFKSEAWTFVVIRCFMSTLTTFYVSKIIFVIFLSSVCNLINSIEKYHQSISEYSLATVEFIEWTINKIMLISMENYKRWRNSFRFILIVHLQSAC